MYVKHRFYLGDRAEDHLQSLVPKFGYNGFGELTFYSRYSRRRKIDGRQEHWPDVVIRAINGTFSIRKDWYLRNHIPWDESFWQDYSQRMALSMYNMEWMPPGRGLWAMGTDFVYERGGMSLYNCAYTNLTCREFSDDISWLMDALMNGVGVGFGPLRDGEMVMHQPRGRFDFRIPDSREGWCKATELLLDAYLKPEQQLPYLIYDDIRLKGEPIRGFGGVASGPEPLIRLHEEIIEQCESYGDHASPMRFKTNIANMVGCCVVAGNVRRSAEIACGSVHDEEFLDLKNYSINPERAAFGWMSNNTALFYEDEDFDSLGEIAKRVVRDGEPGAGNMQNIRYGRIGKKMRSLRFDQAVGFNPCGEVPLEHREVCNVAETLPTMCSSTDRWYKACEYAALYMSTVSLLPTHQPSTNRVVARNRRIGASIIDWTGWKLANGVHKITKWMRAGYEIVVETAKQRNAEAGVPAPIRYTCMKPGGTTPKIPGKTAGGGYPTSIYTIRRIRQQQGTVLHKFLVDAGLPYEKDFYSQNTDVFEYPIVQGPAPPAEEITLWEQAMNLVLLQREWADNAVSCTLYFKPKWRLIEHAFDDFESVGSRYIGYGTWRTIANSGTSEYEIRESYKLSFIWNKFELKELKIYEYNAAHEENSIEPVLSAIIPLVKSVSLLPHTPKGVYKQMPEEGITKDEFEGRLAAIPKIDWSLFQGSDGQDEMYCTGEACDFRPGGS